MFPVVLDVSRLACAVAGNGAAAARRFRLLDEAVAARCLLYSDVPDADTAAAGARLVRRLPYEQEIAGLHILFIAGIAEQAAERLARWARTHGTLVNTEDRRGLCDMHVPAMVRRGDLLLTVSTAGKAPGLARRLRAELEARFGPEWKTRLTEIGRARVDWKAEGAPLPELARRADALIAEKGWL